jgi:hypothetical protein
VITFLGLLAVVALIAANGYFVAAEFAFVAARRGRLDDAAATGDRRAQRAVEVHKQLSFMLSGAQLGITVTSLVVGFIAEPTLGRTLEPVMGAIGVPEGARFGVALTVGFVLATLGRGARPDRRRVRRARQDQRPPGGPDRAGHRLRCAARVGGHGPVEPGEHHRRVGIV